ncbi:hypothetical protein TEA_022433 [Camellia sinensis var. sinensis]|uniref:Pentacotripeptide-repeat region of PRORP domain-containing protein n=1 Tax=Camellia sinensis var. sinensis TaxID=542762 RepID=A0A4S4DI26_CAMSN|nr:hypothetical protein TEA_022433 [Camellia sinensis var. sinensis]
MRPFPPISQCTKALRPILKMGHYDIALRLIGKLHFLGILVNIYTFNIAINCYCRLNQVDFGFSLLGILFKRGYTPNVTTFTTLINGLILQDKTPQAVELFKKLMRTREIEPDVVMYGTIVNGLCRTGNTIRAVSLLRIMEEGSCKPNTIVYNTVIDSLCKDRMVDDAMKLFSKMNEQGFHRDVVTYNSLIHGLCNFGRWKEATGMFREMLDSGRLVENTQTRFEVYFDEMNFFIDCQNIRALTTRKGGPVGEGRKRGVWEFAPPGGPKFESHSPRVTVRATGGLPGR